VAAMTWPTHCHAGQQQQPGLAWRGRLPETDGAKFFCQQSDQAWPLPGNHSPDGVLASLKRGSTHLIIALLLIHRPREDERLSWPGWLTCSGPFTHISGHPSAAAPSSTRRLANIAPICTLKHVLALVQYPNRCS